jgi:hypothetical protein
MQPESAHVEFYPTSIAFLSGGFSIRADFNGGGLSSDLGPLLLRGTDQQIGLTSRLRWMIVTILATSNTPCAIC